MELRVKSLLMKYGFDVAICLALCGLSLWSRWTTLEPIELSGDPLDYWYFVKKWFYGGEWGKLNHHDARFGIHLWLFLIQSTLGESSQFIYLAPLLASTMVILLSYVLTRLISTRAAGIAVCAILIEFDPFIRASSQVRPGIFSAMYVLATSLALVLYARAPADKRFKPLGFVVVFLLLSYLTKLPNLFFTPAVLLVMFLAQRKWKDLGFFAALLVCGFLAESLLQYLIAGGTRVTSSFGRGSGPALREYWDVVLRMTRYLYDECKLIFYPFFAAAPALLAFYGGTKKSSAAQTIVLLPAAFLLIVTFGVRSWEPIRPFQPFHPRYLNVVIPHCTIASVVVVQTALQWWGERSRRAWWGPRTVAVLSFGLALLPAAAHASWLKELNEKNENRTHPWTQAHRSYVMITDAYERGLPIIGPSDKRIGRKRFPRSPPLHWAHKGFVRSDLLVNEEGKLPRFRYQKITRRLSKKSSKVYIPRELRRRAVRRAYRKRKCAVILRRRDRFVSIYGDEWRLPQECNSLPKRKKRKKKRKNKR